MVKKYMGELSDVYKVFIPNQSGNLGYYYRCHFVNHPYLRDDFGTRGNTSMVVKEDGDMIETLNSTYKIISRDIERDMC